MKCFLFDFIFCNIIKTNVRSVLYGKNSSIIKHKSTEFRIINIRNVYFKLLQKLFGLFHLLPLSKRENIVKLG